MTTILFNDTSMIEHLEQLSDTGLDQLHFGVIGFDRDCMVQLYNRFEQTSAGLTRAKVIGLHVFERVAPCLNNSSVAQRYHDAAVTNERLDEKVDHVLTLKMRLTPSTLRLLSAPESPMSYLLIQRHP